MKLADAVQTDTAQLCLDMSADLVENQDSVQVDISEIEGDRQPRSSGLPPQPAIQQLEWPNWQGQGRNLDIEFDDHLHPLVGPVPAHVGAEAAPELVERQANGAAAVAENQDANAAPEPAQEHEQPDASSEASRLEKLFPNSFKITGFKHICDNALSSTLRAIPQSLEKQLEFFLLQQQTKLKFKLFDSLLFV